MYWEVQWLKRTKRDTGPLSPHPANKKDKVEGETEQLQSGMKGAIRIPFWEYNYQISPTSGLLLSDIVVRNTQADKTKKEDVFKSIEFADFQITLSDGSNVAFDVSRALANPLSELTMSEDGVRICPDFTDPLFQRGIELKLVDNVLTDKNGVCNVTIRLSVVFRGEKNDFDPAGFPVALGVWPEISFLWSNDKATKGVRSFRGSVKLTLNNKMFESHGPHHGGSAPKANVASFFTDSNTAFRDYYRHLGGSFLAFGAWARSYVKPPEPFGWGLLFDYNLLDVKREREFVAVYGPKDGDFYRAKSASARTRRYSWPHPAFSIKLSKVERQGFYDNIHVHSKMPEPDDCGHEQIHAPFCGHSCFHLHWRWTTTSYLGATSGPGWKYRGWSNPQGGTPTAHSTDNAPLVPPNQRIVVALCQPNIARHSGSHIIKPDTSGPLDDLEKLFWYCADVEDPIAMEEQVIFSHGAGWSYRYSTPSECDPLNTLLFFLVLDGLPDTPTQIDMMHLFEKQIYPMFRYIQDTLRPSLRCVNIVPEGTYKILKENGLEEGPTMESL